ncbi:hypothetical protein Slala03_80530 [Streptomyces lavendulae subsp. lavendulae]|uniref:hypothetical protein n=1 Tax=Streptomyces lavendulae TaxID=1914 RepID=UPI0024A3D6AD|nr:hypothetical protein [Streptomyces lavendulae]GLV88364.1 hypothetical protein Slala03_80530 [Streptomyces lavendulae subsp. lavendulae]
MLTYQDVMTTDYGRLLTAADKWQSMAEELRKVEERYRDSVQKIHTSGNWAGVSAATALTNFAATRYEYQAAQTQAKATATLLRNGHQQLTELKKSLEAARDDAVKAGMSVSGQGAVASDYDRLSAAEKSAARHDPDYMTSVRTAEQAWREYIKECVKAVDEADKDLRKDLEAVVKDGPGGKGDGTPGTGFNAQAGEVANADDAQKQDRMDFAWLKMRDDETIDDYVERLQKEGLTRLTSNPKLAELVSNVSKTTVTAGAFASALTVAGMNSWKLQNYFKDVKAGNFPKASTAPGTFVPRTANARLAGGAPGGFLARLPPQRHGCPHGLGRSRHVGWPDEERPVPPADCGGGAPCDRRTAGRCDERTQGGRCDAWAGCGGWCRGHRVRRGEPGHVRHRHDQEGSGEVRHGCHRHGVQCLDDRADDSSQSGSRPGWRWEPALPMVLR